MFLHDFLSNKKFFYTIYDYFNELLAAKLISLIEAHNQLILVNIMSCVQSELWCPAAPYWGRIPEHGGYIFNQNKPSGV